MLMVPASTPISSSARIRQTADLSIRAIRAVTAEISFTGTVICRENRREHRTETTTQPRSEIGKTCWIICVMYGVKLNWPVRIRSPPPGPVDKSRDTCGVR